jgi:hypothetical protein
MAKNNSYNNPTNFAVGSNLYRNRMSEKERAMQGERVQRLLELQNS